MDDGSEEGDYRRAALVGLRPDSEHDGCDIFTRRIRDIYSSRLHIPSIQVLRWLIRWRTEPSTPDGAREGYDRLSRILKPGCVGDGP